MICRRSAEFYSVCTADLQSASDAKRIPMQSKTLAVRQITTLRYAGAGCDPLRCEAAPGYARWQATVWSLSSQRS